MKTNTHNVVLAAGTIAQLASAHPHLERRDLVTDWTTTTDIVYVTVDGPSPSADAKFHIGHHHHSFSFPGNGDSSVTTSPATVATVATTQDPSPTATALPTNTAPAETTQTEAPPPTDTDSATSSPTGTTPTDTAGSALTTTSSPAGTASASGSGTAPPAPSGSTNSFSTNGLKAGLSGFPKIAQNFPGVFDALVPYIGWYSDYWPNTTDLTTSSGQVVKGIPMLWGDDISCYSGSHDRAVQYNDTVGSTNDIPIMFGFYEPDSDCATGSSQITNVQEGVDAWNWYLSTIPDSHSTTLASPPMADQYDETWLTSFVQSDIRTNFTITSIHVNKPNLSEAMRDVEYYWDNYGKPIWVSEFACVNDKPTWEPVDDTDTINTFINDVVPYFECNEHVIAYGPSTGEGLTSEWAMVDQSGTGSLAAAGTTYLNALQAVQKNGCAFYGY